MTRHRSTRIVLGAVVALGIFVFSATWFGLSAVRRRSEARWRR